MLTLSQPGDATFPHAKIVADRLRVIKLMISTFHEFIKEEKSGIRRVREITVTLRTKGENLNEKQRQLLRNALEQHPATETSHAFKEKKLCSLLIIKEQNEPPAYLCRPS